MLINHNQFEVKLLSFFVRISVLENPKVGIAAKYYELEQLSTYNRNSSIKNSTLHNCTTKRNAETIK